MAGAARLHRDYLLLLRRGRRLPLRLGQWTQAVQIGFGVPVVLVDREVHRTVAEAFERLSETADADFAFAPGPVKVDLDRNQFLAAARLRE